jgi:hypothetical protein
MSWEEGDFLENWVGGRPNPQIPKKTSFKKKWGVSQERFKGDKVFGV